MAATPTIVPAPNAPLVKSITRDGKHHFHWVAAYSVSNDKADLVLYPPPEKGAAVFIQAPGAGGWRRESDGRTYDDQELSESLRGKDFS
jgi:hypothetical protein